MSFPKVLGSLKSGAGWPTSTAPARLGSTTNEDIASAVPNRTQLSIRLLGTLMCVPPSTPFRTFLGAVFGHGRAEEPTGCHQPPSAAPEECSIFVPPPRLPRPAFESC